MICYEIISENNKNKKMYKERRHNQEMTYKELWRTDYFLQYLKPLILQITGLQK